MTTNTKIAEIKVSYYPSLLEKYKISNSKESFELILEQWEKDTISMQEEVKVILLNRNNKALGVYSLAKGGITTCVVDIRLILSVALKTLATGLIIVHNHPSGSLNPSTDDKKITQQLKSACKLMGIDLLDHLIITKDAYYSFADEGVL